MNHLAWNPRSSRPGLEVPYLCSDEPPCLGFDNFVKWPFLRKWPPPELGTGPAEDPHNCLQLAERLQSWLYFGLLSVALQGFFNLDEFLNTSTSSGISVDSSVLLGLLRDHVGTDSLESNTNGKVELSAWGSLIIRALRIAADTLRTTAIPAIKSSEHSLGPRNVWDSPVYRVFLSVDLLIETLYGHLSRTSSTVPDATIDRPVFAVETQGIAESLALTGYCPSLPNRLNLGSEHAYRLLSMSSTNRTDTHSPCSRQSCAVFNVVRQTYRVKHVEGCLSCKTRSIAHQELLEIVDRGQIPLVSSTIDSKNRLVLEIVAGTALSVYTAISHVWAGGLGNFQANALPECQLRQIHFDVDNNPMGLEKRGKLPSLFAYDFQKWKTGVKMVYQRGIKRKSRKLYWLDTLCIPIGSDVHRKKAINSMAHIYAGAVNVLVLDPELRNMRSEDLSPAELDLAVAGSPWMARSWTLQEGALAIDLRLKFTDAILNFPAASGPSSLLSQSGVRKVWSGEIMSKNHPERAGSLLKYAKNVLEGLMFAIYIRPSRTSSSETYEAERFLTAWNDLAGRSTTQPADIAAIFASLLHVSAGEVLGLPEHMRMKALLKIQRHLPVSLLFAPSFYSVDTVDWTLDFPDCSRSIHRLDGTKGWMKVTDSGFIITSARSLLLCQPYIPTSGAFFIRDVLRNGSLFIDFHTKSMEQSDDPGDTHVFLLSNIEDSWGTFKGLCLTWIGDDSALHVRLHKTFSWRYASSKKVLRESMDSDKYYDVASPLKPDDISPQHPLIIKMDIQHWPNLKWSRLESFPFVQLGLGQEQLVDVMPLLTFILWLGTLGEATVPIVAGFVYSSDGFSWNVQDAVKLASTLLGTIVLIGVIRHYLTMFEYDIIRRSEVRWVQAKWAASFLDASALPQGQQTSLPPFIVKTLSVHVVVFILFAVLTMMFSRPFYKAFHFWSNQEMIMKEILLINKESPALLPALYLCFGLSIEMLLRIAIFTIYIFEVLRSLRTPRVRYKIQTETSGQRVVRILMLGVYMMFLLLVAFMCCICTIYLVQHPHADFSSRLKVGFGAAYFAIMLLALLTCRLPTIFTLFTRVRRFSLDFLRHSREPDREIQLE